VRGKNSNGLVHRGKKEKPAGTIEKGKKYTDRSEPIRLKKLSQGKIEACLRKAKGRGREISAERREKFHSLSKKGLWGRGIGRTEGGRPAGRRAVMRKKNVCSTPKEKKEKKNPLGWEERREGVLIPNGIKKGPTLLAVLKTARRERGDRLSYLSEKEGGSLLGKGKACKARVHQYHIGKITNY